MSSYGNQIAKAKELLELMGLWEKREELALDISYGEQRKMEIALSLASDPRLILLDEPSAGLTAEESSDLVEMIHKLGRDITVIVVAHDMDLVFGLADRIIVLHYGLIIVQGTPEEIQADSRVKEIYMGIEEGEEDAETY
jgi:branched-chain amino acid transport system ATP-binding protein